jgi:hypothetical protein
MSLKDASWRWSEVAVRSDALFGSPHRLRVALLVGIADADELYAAKIAHEAGIDRTEAMRELAHFQAAEMLVPAARPPKDQGQRGRGRPPQYLQRRDEQAWAALEALGARFRRSPPQRATAP